MFFNAFLNESAISNIISKQKLVIQTIVQMKIFYPIHLLIETCYPLQIQKEKLLSITFAKRNYVIKHSFHTKTHYPTHFLKNIVLTNIYSNRNRIILSIF